MLSFVLLPTCLGAVNHDPSLLLPNLFVAEYDADGYLWPILQDTNANAVAMLDDAGAIVRQRVFSPYGRVISSEKPTGLAPPKSRVGHQGLFAERLDAVTTADPLDAGSRVAWHNRNRTFLPELGRFAQRDPNETGQAARGTLNMHGTAFHDAASAPDPMATFGDGMNVYAYAMGSPTQNQDPSGLFVGFLVPGPSDFVTGALSELVHQYSERLIFDVEWATDWDAGDDWHSRSDNSWVNLALMKDVYDSFDFGLGPFTINPLHLFAGRYVPGRTFPMDVRLKAKNSGKVPHHIASPYGTHGVELRKIFDRAGVQLNDPKNALLMPRSDHRGRHPKSYHDEVERTLKKAIRNKHGRLLPKKDRPAALRAALDGLAARIESGSLRIHN